MGWLGLWVWDTAISCRREDTSTLRRGPFWMLSSMLAFMLASVLASMLAMHARVRAGIRVGIACLAMVVMVACSGGRGVVGAGPGALEEAAGLARGQAVIAQSTEEPLPPRAELLALAQSIEARAVREGGGARATELHAVAGRLVERVWRVERRDQDAKEAIDMLRAAARNAGAPGACEAGMRGAILAG